MLNKKILSLILAAAALTPVTTTAVETFDTECVEAATGFIPVSSIGSSYDIGVRPLYAVEPNYGDVNMDGKIDIKDYTILKKYIESENKEKFRIDTRSADITGDGKIDEYDLRNLKLFL